MPAHQGSTGGTPRVVLAKFVRPVPFAAIYKVRLAGLLRSAYFARFTGAVAEFGPELPAELCGIREPVGSGNCTDRAFVFRIGDRPVACCQAPAAYVVRRASLSFKNLVKLTARNSKLRLNALRGQILRAQVLLDVSLGDLETRGHDGRLRHHDRIGRVRGAGAHHCDGGVRGKRPFRGGNIWQNAGQRPNIVAEQWMDKV